MFVYFNIEHYIIYIYIYIAYVYIYTFSHNLNKNQLKVNHDLFAKSPDDEIRIVDTWRSFAWPIDFGVQRMGANQGVSHYKFTMFYPVVHHFLPRIFSFFSS